VVICWPTMGLVALERSNIVFRVALVRSNQSMKPLFFNEALIWCKRRQVRDDFMPIMSGLNHLHRGTD
jgi:hypothetical protein